MGQGAEERQEKTETNLENLFPRLVVFCLLLSSALRPQPAKENEQENRGRLCFPIFLGAVEGWGGQGPGNRIMKMKIRKQKIIFIYLIILFPAAPGSLPLLSSSSLPKTPSGRIILNYKIRPCFWKWKKKGRERRTK